MTEPATNLPINLDDWILENGASLKPPIGNKQFFKDRWENLLVMIVGGPNYRPDYHDDPGEELFIQLRGDVTLKLIDPVTRERSEVIVREGEMHLLPAHVRHSPQRPEGCIGLVIERYRQPGEIDALEWYGDDGNLEFRGRVPDQEYRNRSGDRAGRLENLGGRIRDRRIPTTWRVGSDLPA